MFSAVAPGHENPLLLVLLYFTKARHGQDPQERANVGLLASTSAAPVREISILMTSARSEGGKRGEVSCQKSPGHTSARLACWF